MKQEIVCWNCAYKGEQPITKIVAGKTSLYRAICPECQAVIIVNATKEEKE